MKIQIRNRTHWNTAQLRAFIRRGIRTERTDLCRRGAPPLRVTVAYNRGGNRYTDCSGRAAYNSNWMKLMVPSGAVDRIDLAHTIVHELGHTAGIRHPQMTHDPVYSRAGNWRELYAWAETMPLDKAVAVRIRPTRDARVAHAAAMLRRAMTREKRAVTLRKKWTVRLRRLERAAAPIAS